MKRNGFEYELLHVDRHTGARLGRLTTPRGTIDLPAFMPVGTCGSVKGLTFGQVEETGAQIVLGNTYHLALRPGAEVVEQMGGLHSFIGWPHPILTDSGGFQLFSLAKLTKLNEAGAAFRSHIDGRLLELSPEKSVDIQERLGSDIAMVLDHVIGLPASEADVREACERSVRWADRCQKAHRRGDQIQFAIVQGGLNESLRKWCAEELVAMDFPGYAVGGLSVGEEPEEMYRVTSATTWHLPAEKPRYLMGVGRPQDLLEGVGRGIDMFDCVMPTRNGRNASAFTDEGQLNLRNQCHQFDPRPVMEGLALGGVPLSRSYLRHLFISGEMLGPILLSWHNIAYYQRLMRQAREAIANDAYREFSRERMEGWGEPVRL